ncbi:MAG: Omp28-related outer membrane protein [Bacteroidaceae bacterium]|nr:Omp28-related outer membrane protein [Bacteroidaceae bacterium]
MTNRLKIMLVGLCALSMLSCVGVHEDDDIISAPTVDTEQGGSATGTRFYHRILTYEYTASWCQYCPNMAAALAEAKKERSGRIIEIAIHQYDSMEAPESASLVAQFSVNSFPLLVFDMDATTKLQDHSTKLITDYIDKTVPLDAGGIAIDATSKESLTIKVTSAAKGDYKLLVALLEDGIIENQVGYGPGYVNNAVLCKMLSENEGTSLGKLNKGEETEAHFTLTETENKRIVVSLLKQDINGNWLSNNVAQCNTNAKIDYLYEQD